MLWCACPTLPWRPVRLNGRLQLPTVRNGYVQQLFDVFLPAGYPSSVTDDYIQYV